MPACRIVALVRPVLDDDLDVVEQLQQILRECVNCFRDQDLKCSAIHGLRLFSRAERHTRRGLRPHLQCARERDRDKDQDC